MSYITHRGICNCMMYYVSELILVITFEIKDTVLSLFRKENQDYLAKCSQQKDNIACEFILM